jgi:23S rRNA pseudouridine2605 synthase
MATERLQKILAAAGVDSRRNCEQLILQGLVRVNGKIMDTLPVFADIDKDVIIVEGRRIHSARKVYYLFNKPKGVLCTNYDPSGRRIAIDYIDAGQRIFCAGRLDAETTGAIIITNDTGLADRLTHPRYGVEKTYLVEIRGKISAEVIEKLKKGMWFSEGRAAPAKVKVLKASENVSVLEVRIRQSLNRQIQRVMARFGYKVASIKRTHIGRISLQKLGVGEYRPLTQTEVEYINKDSGGEGRNFVPNHKRRKQAPPMRHRQH